MRGRKPTASVIKLMTGNPGRRPLNAHEAKPPIAAPKPPTVLTGEALTEWKRITKLLAEVGLLTHLDRAMVAAYCQAWARWLECEAEVKKNGLIIKSPNGFPIYSPYWTAANKCLDQMKQMAGEIGLSGSARSRIKAGEPPAYADPAESFLSASA